MQLEPGPTATTLLLVRHAETEDNVSMRLSGWTDTDLSPRGEDQIERLADHFNRQHGHIEALYSSPLIRARRQFHLLPVPEWEERRRRPWARASLSFASRHDLHPLCLAQ